MDNFLKILGGKGLKYQIVDGTVTVHGTLDLSGRSKVSLPEKLVVLGNLHLRSVQDVTLPKRLLVAESLDLSRTLVKELPEDLVVGAHFCIDHTPIKTLPANLVVGGTFMADDSALEVIPNNMTFGGSVSLIKSAVKQLPTGLTVGGSIDVYKTQIKDIPEDIKISGHFYPHTNDIEATNLYKKLGLLSWRDGKYVKGPYSLLEVTDHLDNAREVSYLKSGEISYLVTDESGAYAYGDTPTEASDYLYYKTNKLTQKDYKDLTLESVLTYRESVNCYVKITNACLEGVCQFIRDNGIRRQDYTVQQIADMAKDEYGGQRFLKFFK